MEPENRRGFIKKSMVATAGMTVGAPAYIKGFASNKPSDVINVAVAGIRSRGDIITAEADIRPIIPKLRGQESSPSVTLMRIFFHRPSQILKNSVEKNPKQWLIFEISWMIRK